MPPAAPPPPPDPDEPDDLARQVVAAAVSRGVTLGTAESLTAGLVCSALGGVPGVSAVLRGGLVTYTEETKQALLGVEPAVLEAVGAVSEQVARQMAAGACRALGADLAVSTTGVAGPGPSDGVPAGTVHLAVHDRHGRDGRPAPRRGRRPAAGAGGGDGGGAGAAAHPSERVGARPRSRAVTPVLTGRGFSLELRSNPP